MLGFEDTLLSRFWSSNNAVSSSGSFDVSGRVFLDVVRLIGVHRISLSDSSIVACSSGLDRSASRVSERSDALSDGDIKSITTDTESFARCSMFKYGPESENNLN